MKYTTFSNWIEGYLTHLNRLKTTARLYLIFLMIPMRKHTLDAAARMSNSTKSTFSNLLKNHPNQAIQTLNDISKKQAKKISKHTKGLASEALPWSVAILIDSTLQKRSSLHTKNSKRFNHGKGFVIGHQWTNIVLRFNDTIIPLPPIPFYSKTYCKEHKLEYKTENTRVVEYIDSLNLEEYVWGYSPQRVVVLADSGYDDQKIQNSIAKKGWRFIISLKTSRSVKTEKTYHETKKSNGWKSINLLFKNNRYIGWKTIRINKSHGKKTRMEFRTRQIIGYIRNFGKAQLICSEYKKKTKGPRKFLACNDLTVTPRQIVIGYRLRWAIELFHKDVKMFLGFEDVSAKWFSSIISHVHWVYCAYILMKSSPPGIPKTISSLSEIQNTIKKCIQSRQLPRLNQLLSQFSGVEKLKTEIFQAIDGHSEMNKYIFQHVMIE